MAAERNAEAQAQARQEADKAQRAAEGMERLRNNERAEAAVMHDPFVLRAK